MLKGCPILIAHPDLQHAHRLAEALHEGRALVFLLTGVPIFNQLIWRRFPAAKWVMRGRQANIPQHRALCLILFPVLTKVLLSLFKGPLGNEYKHRLNLVFDLVSAFLMPLYRPKIVICYEVSALFTFRVAKRLGAMCILDAASVHPDAGAELGEGVLPRSPEWIAARKRAEIALADLVLCCSPFAAETYRGSVPEARLRAVPLGADLPMVRRRPRPAGEPIRFVFVGPASFRKGADILLDIFSKLDEELPATLTFVGSIGDAEIGQRMSGLSKVRHLGHLPQSQLFDVLKDFDCLVLPSRFDAFAMVVPECMGVGLPAIVSDRVGAKCIIEEFPGAGWIVPCEPEALEAKILELLAHPEVLEAASIEARRAAEAYTWAAYKQRVFAVIETAYREFQGGE